MTDSQSANTESMQITPNDSGDSKGLVDIYLEEYSNDPEFIAEGLAIDLMEDVARLQQIKGISRSDLAVLMNVSKAYVTKLLNSPPNLTLTTVARLGIALEAKPYIGLTEKISSESALIIFDASLPEEDESKALLLDAATGFTFENPLFEKGATLVAAASAFGLQRTTGVYAIATANTAEYQAGTGATIGEDALREWPDISIRNKDSAVLIEA